MTNKHSALLGKRLTAVCTSLCNQRYTFKFTERVRSRPCLCADMCVLVACPTSVLVHHQRPNGVSWRPVDKLKVGFQLCKYIYIDINKHIAMKILLIWHSSNNVPTSATNEYCCVSKLLYTI